MKDYAAIETTAHEAGLTVRGGFQVEGGDGLPGLADGRAARTVILLGNVGSSLWPAFSVSPELNDGAARPLDAAGGGVGGRTDGRHSAVPV